MQSDWQISKMAFPRNSSVGQVVIVDGLTAVNRLHQSEAHKRSHDAWATPGETDVVGNAKRRLSGTIRFSGSKPSTTVQPVSVTSVVEIFPNECFCAAAREASEAKGLNQRTSDMPPTLLISIIEA